MGILDKVFDRDDKDDTKKKADFSSVQGGAASTAPTPRPAAPPASTAGATGGNRTYTVQAGDSLSKIAKREYGDAAQWKRIHEANKDTISNPDLIQPGQTLRLP